MNDDEQTATIPLTAPALWYVGADGVVSRIDVAVPGLGIDGNNDRREQALCEALLKFALKLIEEERRG